MTYDQFTQKIADCSDLIEFACFDAVSAQLNDFRFKSCEC